jgi:hypothetical protein
MLTIRIYETAFSPVVSHGCETESLALREERNMQLYENVVQAGSKKVETNEQCAVLRHEELRAA